MAGVCGGFELGRGKKGPGAAELSRLRGDGGAGGPGEESMGGTERTGGAGRGQVFERSAQVCEGRWPRTTGGRAPSRDTSGFEHGDRVRGEGKRRKLDAISRS